MKISWLQGRKPHTKLVGLAIDPDVLTAVVLKRNDGIAKIESLSIIPPEDGNLRAPFRNWVVSNQLEGAICYLVVNQDHAATYQVERPMVEENELEEAIGWQIKDSIGFDLDDAVIDTFDFPADALRGRKPIVNAVVARKTDIREFVSLVDYAGLDLEAIDVPEMAFRNIASIYAEEGRPIAMLTMDEAAGTVSIFKDDQLYLSRHINITTSVFAASGDIEKEEEGIEQLCLEIQRSLDYFESQLNQAAPKRLLLYATTGSAILHEAISSRLNIEATILDLRRLGIDIGSREIDIDERVSSVRAVGAALRQESV